jgi:exodeoxyribonuclease-3
MQRTRVALFGRSFGCSFECSQNLCKKAGLSKLKIYSWNVNGIRACVKNGFVDWFKIEQPDVIGLQEVRASESQVPGELLSQAGYFKYWHPAEKKGYSGTAILSKAEPIRIFSGMDDPKFDCEGRVLTCEFKDFYFVSAYFPNSQDAGARLHYKLDFGAAIRSWLSKNGRDKKPVVLAGDMNIAHRPIDLARPAENEKTAGYLPEEREWMEAFLQSGWIDSFRKFYPSEVKYSWWSMRMRARERNVGWRIDYHLVSANGHSHILNAGIDDQVKGSDHAPVWIELEF